MFQEGKRGESQGGQRLESSWQREGRDGQANRMSLKGLDWGSALIVDGGVVPSLSLLGPAGSMQNL